MNMPHTGLDPVAFAFLKLSHLKEANKDVCKELLLSEQFM
jgi:hypothetical protein